MNYNEVRGSLFMTTGTLFTMILLFLGKDSFSTNTFRIGPCKEDDNDCALIFGVKISNWFTWSSLMLFIFMKEAIISYAYTSYSPYYNNVVMDHKTDTINHHKWIIVMMVVNYKTFVYIDKIIDISLVVTMEIQYIFCSYLVEVVIYVLNTLHAINCKNKDGLTFVELENFTL